MNTEIITKDFMDNLFSIKGKVAIVTGATGALGRAVAMAYALADAKVVITGRNQNKLKELEQEIREKGGEAKAIAADPLNEKEFQNVVNSTVESYGTLDILFVAHGYSSPKGILEQSVEEWQYIMDVNLKSVYITCKQVAEKMVELKNKGKMVVVSSARSKRGMKEYTGYCASKAACDLMVQAMAGDLTAKYGINVNTINPILFRSEMSEWMFDPDSGVHQNYLKRLPIGRLGEPHDFIGLAILLSSSGSDFLTGGNYDATGGYWSC